MKVYEAKNLAIKWIREEGCNLPGFSGAFFKGSVNWMEDNDEFPTTSDIDICLIISGDMKDSWRKKLLYHGVILEPTFHPRCNFESTEQVLTDFRYACHFTMPSIISDPQGFLKEIQKKTDHEYKKRKWVKLRYEKAIKTLSGYVNEYLKDQSLIFSLRVFWLSYVVNMASQIVALADLRNPTIRKCLVVLKEVVTEYNRPEIHQSLLSVLGCLRTNRDGVESLIPGYRDAFLKAVKVRRTPFVLDSYIEECDFEIVVDGALEMIENGYHQEAVSWIVFIYSLSETAIQYDADDAEKITYFKQYRNDISKLGISNKNDLEHRIKRFDNFLKILPKVTEQIMDNNAEVTK